jgi:A/G-specific adenine glycosylase
VTIRSRLLAWYDRNARDLPWRRTRDPYAIWVSEIMLQQTRVETVIPYFERFLARFPDVHALAHASEDEVLSMWSGLGYYRRARLLHRGVKTALADHGGRVPEDPLARASLPGIGRYTAGAIGSIAFEREEPIVDGNVARVLSRVHGIEAPLGSKASEARLWNEASAIVRGPRPGALNQALMELGAMVCTPLAPKCETCPIRASCAARASDRVVELPVPRKKKPPTPVAMVAVVARPRGDTRPWLVRTSGALFGGLYAVPMREGRDRVAARRALAEHGLSGVVGASLGEVVHVLTHRRLTVHVFEAVSTRARATSTRRLDPADVGIATLTRKILRLADRATLVPRS